MTIYTPAGFFFVVSILLLVIKLPVFSAADTKWHTSSSRTLTLDGLRGYLATGVFIHHAVIYYQYLTEGFWDNPPSHLYTQLGPVGVSLFFMITGYLFWGKVITAEGRPKWINLLIGRVFRIGPVYFLTMALMLLIIFVKTEFNLQEPLAKVLSEIAPLLFFGIFEPGHAINGFNSPRSITAAVTWTLRYEWIFYLIILPVSALFARNRKLHIIYSIAVVLICLFASTQRNASSNSLLLAAFFIGMVGASLQANNFTLAISDKSMSAVVVTALWLIFFTPLPMHKTVQTILSGVVFLSVINGCSIFGLLISKSAQRLGEISYGIYLLQGIVLYLFVQLPDLRNLATSTTFNYWIFVLCEAIVLVSIAFLAYCWIEKPAIASGKKIIFRMQNNSITPK